MKTSRLSIHNVCTRTNLLCIFIALCFVFSCGEQKEDPLPIMQEKPDLLIEDEFADASARLGHFMKKNKGKPINLKGHMIYTYTSSKKALKKVSMQNPCDVTLTIHKHEIQLDVIEHTPPPEGDRPYSLYGKLKKGAKIEFSYPVPFFTIPGVGEINVTDIIYDHLGCNLFGPGTQEGTLIYKGDFDGKKLNAEAVFTLQCDEVGPNNDIFPTPVQGPVMAKWKFKLKVAPK